MNNILQKRILELTYQNNLLREEIEKLKKNLLNEARVKVICDDKEVWVDEADVHDAINDGCHEAGGRSSGGRSSSWSGGGSGWRSSSWRGEGSGRRSSSPQTKYAAKNSEWHKNNIEPLIATHGLDARKLDEHGFPHPQHMEEMRQHPNFGAYIEGLKAAHEKGNADFKSKHPTGTGSGWHFAAFNKINPVYYQLRSRR